MSAKVCQAKDTADAAEQASPRINPFHLLSHPDSDSNLPPLPPHLEKLASGDDVEATIPMPNGEPPVHITKVKRDFVQVSAAGDTRPTIIDKVGNVFKRDPMQQPPPSPPISDDADEDAPVFESEDSHAPTRPNGADAPSLFTHNLTAEPGDMSSPVRTEHLGVPSGSSRRVSSSSTTSRTGSLAVVRAQRAAQQRNPSPVAGDSEDVAPTLPAPPRFVRSNTSPSSPVVTRSPLLHSQSTLAPPRTTVPGLDGSALDSDILAHTEIIRRERLERRQKKVSGEPETATLKPEPKKEDPKVLVGNLIGEDHVNYVLMYNMLTGIRIGVSRCQAKIKRPLTDEDYTARHKFSFDM